MDHARRITCQHHHNSPNREMVTIMKVTIEQQQEALQNFANLFEMEIKTFKPEDRRRNKKFLLIKGGSSISPLLDFEKMNSFLLGMNAMQKLKTN